MSTSRKPRLPQHAIFLAGAGGVGKTSVLQRILELEPDRFLVMPSITRDVYKAMGWTEQSALAAPLEERIKFQQLLFKTHCDKVQEIADAMDRTGKSAIFDRCPLDYVSYQISTIDTLTLAQIKSLSQVADTLMRSAGKEAELKIFYFPYPVPWAGADDMSDGLRYAPASKNLSWNSNLRHLLYGPLNLRQHARTLTKSTVNGRVYEILREVTE